jgi:hypothetical protein
MGQFLRHVYLSKVIYIHISSPLWLLLFMYFSYHFLRHILIPYRIVCIFILPHYPKRANLSASCGVPFSSKGLCSRFLAGCWTVPLSVSVQFSSQFYFRWITFRRFRKMAQSYYKLRRVCVSVCSSVSVRMKQLGFNRTDFNGIWCLSIFLKSIEKIQLSFNSDSNLYCTLRCEYIYDNISLNYS